MRSSAVSLPKMPAAFSSPRSGAPLTTKSLRNADLGRLAATTRRSKAAPAATSERREQQLRAALATARQEAASARAAARVCAEALVQAERSNGAPGTATKTLLAAAKEADATRETQQASKDAQDKLRRRQKELREELQHLREVPSMYTTSPEDADESEPSIGVSESANFLAPLICQWQGDVHDLHSPTEALNCQLQLDLHSPWEALVHC